MKSIKYHSRMAYVFAAMLVALLAFGGFAPTASAMRTPTKPPIAATGGGTLTLYVCEISTSWQKPLAGALVVIYDRSGDAIAKGISDADGRYMTDLPAGTYKVIVTLKGYSNGVSLAVVKEAMDSRVNVGLIKGPAVADAVKVTIFVYDPRGDGIFPLPIPNALVRVFDYQGTPVGKGLTDERGNFTLPLKGGKFTVTVQADGYKDGGSLITLKGDERELLVPVELMP